MHPGEPQVHIVVGQKHLGDASDEVGFVLHEPGELADCERGDRYRTHPCCPGFGPDRLGETGGFGGGLGVVPELGGPERSVVGIEHDHAVLLAPDADRRNLTGDGADLTERSTSAAHQRSGPARCEGDSSADERHGRRR